MSTTISGTSSTNYGLVSQLVADSASVHQRLDQLTTQAADGLVSTTYAGLGAGAQVSLDLSSQMSAMQTWQNNIKAASGSMQVTQAAMTQLQQISANFLSQTANLEGANSSEIDTVAASARQALQQVAGLLDTQYDGNYVFAGQDSSNPPVPNSDNILSSGFYTQINAQVGLLSSQGAAVTAANTLAIASSNAVGTSPFSIYLSQPPASLQMPTIQVGQGQYASFGLFASANSTAISTGSSTTGSYMRDLMRALATIGSMSSSQVGVVGFQTLVQDTNASLTGAVTAMAQDAGMLGNQQSSLTTAQTTMSDTTTALTTQLGSVQDVNMASTLSNLSLVQTQLQASYQLIAGMSSLTLAKYLPVG